MNEQAATAWTKLIPRVLNATVDHFNLKVLLIKKPQLDITDYTWYPLDDIVQAWDLMILAAPEMKGNPGFEFDLVDFTRQYLANLAAKYVSAGIEAFHSNNSMDIAKANRSLSMLLDDLDLILGTNDNFLLGSWLNLANNVPGATSQDSALYEYNARNQITLWGDKGQILDYAAKQWNGLVKDYYKPRWNLFFNHLYKCSMTGKPFDQAAFDKDFMDNVGTPFTMARNKYPDKGSCDSVEIATDIYKRWRPKFVNLGPTIVDHVSTSFDSAEMGVFVDMIP